MKLITRNLIDKETAVNDIIQDYEREANLIIKETAEGHNQDLIKFRTGAGTLKRKHEVAFSNMLIDVAKVVKKVQKRPVADVLNHCNAQQRDLRRQIDAALLACGE